MAAIKTVQYVIWSIFQMEKESEIEWENPLLPNYSRNFAGKFKNT